MNQNEMSTFDVSSIPSEFSPLRNLDDVDNSQLYEKDDKLYVKFHTEAVLHPANSTKAGRPIYNDVDMITIRTPGSQLTSIVSPVKYYMDRFGAKYREWKSSQMEAASGTPLGNFPFLFTKPSLIAELKYRNIFTVEQLAELSDTGKQSIMGGHELCKRASMWLEQTLFAAEDAEKAELKQQLATMQAQMAILMAAQSNTKPAEPEPTVKSSGKKAA
jgi:hypothetical protein